MQETIILSIKMRRRSSLPLVKLNSGVWNVSYPIRRIVVQMVAKWCVMNDVETRSMDGAIKMCSKLEDAALFTMINMPPEEVYFWLHYMAVYTARGKPLNEFLYQETEVMAHDTCRFGHTYPEMEIEEKKPLLPTRKRKRGCCCWL